MKWSVAVSVMVALLVVVLLLVQLAITLSEDPGPAPSCWALPGKHRPEDVC